MPLTQEQLERRRQGIGSSDIPAILGYSKWANAHDIYLQKVYGTDSPATDAMKAGNYLEEGILRWFADETGKVVAPGIAFSHPDGVSFSHPDGLVAEDGFTIPVDAKNAGAFSSQEFGSEEGDNVPDYINIQIHHQMAICGAPYAHVAALIGGNLFKPYTIERDNDLAEETVAKAAEFWKNHVLPKVPPSETPHLETLKHLRRQPEEIYLSDDLADLFEAREECAQAKKNWENREEDAKAKILAALGDAEAGGCGIWKVTYKSQHRKEYTVKESDFRVARFSKVKGY